MLKVLTQHVTYNNNIDPVNKFKFMLNHQHAVIEIELNIDIFQCDRVQKHTYIHPAAIDIRLV